MKIIKEIAGFILLFFLMFLLVGASTYIFVKFNYITFKSYFALSFTGGLTLAFIIWLVILIKAKIGKVTSISDFILNNVMNILVFFTFLCLFANSVEKKLIWNTNKMFEVLQIEWTIFTISIALFIFWPTIMSKYLLQNKPEFVTKDNPISHFESLCKKRAFYIDLKWTTSSILYIIVNLVSIILSTLNAIFYEYNILTQTVLIFSFYMCTNTIFTFMIDIVKAILILRKNYLKEYKVTVDEYNKAKKEANSYVLEFNRLYNKYGETKITLETDLSAYSKEEAVSKMITFIDRHYEFNNFFEHRNDELIGNKVKPFFEIVINNENGSYTVENVIEKTKELLTAFKDEKGQTEETQKIKKRGRPKGSKNKKKEVKKEDN